MKSLPENFIQASTLQDPSLRELQILEGEEMDWKSTNWVSYLCSACGFCAKKIAYIYHPSEAATVCFWILQSEHVDALWVPWSPESVMRNGFKGLI